MTSLLLLDSCGNCALSAVHEVGSAAQHSTIICVHARQTGRGEHVPAASPCMLLEPQCPVLLASFAMWRAHKGSGNPAPHPSLGDDSLADTTTHAEPVRPRTGCMLQRSQAAPACLLQGAGRLLHCMASHDVTGGSM